MAKWHIVERKCRKNLIGSCLLGTRTPSPQTPHRKICNAVRSAISATAGQLAKRLTLVHSAVNVFLQRVSIACCTSYRKSVRLSVCLSVTRWHCVKTTPATIMGSSLEDSPTTLVSSSLTSAQNSKGSLGRHAQLTRCFSAVAELLVIKVITGDASTP